MTMGGSVERPLHTEGAVSDYFLIESHLLATRTADAYKAIDRSRNIPSIVWMLRHPLARQSEAVKRFLHRMEAIDRIDPPVCDMTAYGVDSAGVAFAVFPSIDGHSIVSGNIERAEAERRFISCLRLVENLHISNIACGDLCGSSFWVERGGEVRVLGVMGSFDTEAAATAMVPPLDTLHFLAPEQRSGAGFDTTTDVFALGVLGFFLFTRHYPYQIDAHGGLTHYNHAGVPPLASLINQPPVWAEEILLRALHPDPRSRYQTAGEMALAISEVRARAASSTSIPTRVATESGRRNAALVARPIPQPALHTGASPVAARPTAEPPPQVPEKRDGLSSARLFLLGVLFLSAAAYVLFSDLLSPAKPKSTSDLSVDLDVHRKGAGSEQLREAIDTIGDESSLAEKAAQLERMANSDDPLAHDILVKSARDAKSDRLRNLSEQAIIDRARRLGLLRSAEQVRQWLRSVKTGQLPVNYEPVLQALDTTLPLEARTAALRQAYPANAILVLRLTAALALDTNELQAYQPVLSQLVGDAAKDESLGSRSTLGLILSNPELALVFGDDAVQRREQIPSEDILWLLKILAERNDTNVRVMASLAMERGILSPLRSAFLAVVRDRDDIDAGVLAALIRASAGALRVEDISSFGRWYDVQSERTLLAVCADATEPAVLTEAFDTLAGKSLSIEPSASLVNWIRVGYWDQRLNFVRAIGALGVQDLISTEELRSAFAAFDKYVRDPRLIDILVQSAPASVLTLLIERHAERLGLGGLLGLLAHPSKEVRIVAVRSLKGFNDIGALKLIIDSFEREQDEEVKAAYRESFWVIREREGGGARKP